MTDATEQQNNDTADEEGVTADGAATSQDDGPQPESFDREYVQKLRDEAASHRVKAKRADALNARLATAHAALTGKLAETPPTCRSPTTCSTTTGSSTTKRCWLRSTN